ncbi:MAG: 2-hydroxyacyl-CoA dehydratase family protein [Firmicutes bacterium]|nr:2-hydroxyacyl-CoA dehydratase family protein [Bacillota bacterium]
MTPAYPECLPDRRLEADRRLKGLIVKHYLEAHRAKGLVGRRPVVWVTSGAPVEILLALGFLPVYPENYGALCASRKRAVPYCEEAERAGFSQDLCAYARANIGSMLLGRGELAGRTLPAPDLLVACKNICDVVVKWWEVTARHFGCPLYIVDTPFAVDGLTPEQVAYVKAQLGDLVTFASRAVRRRPPRRPVFERRLLGVLDLSRQAVSLWNDIQALRRVSPTPASALDMFTNLFPIVTLRGTRTCVDYYRTVRDELEARVRRGVAAVPGERFRLVWDNIAVWYDFDLVRYLHARGAAFVGETYTDAWGAYDPSDADESDPLGSLARMYSLILLNVGLPTRRERLFRMVREQRAAGVVFHSCRSCKTYSLGQYELARAVREELGLPTLVIVADMADSRAFAAGPTRTRIDAFVELLAANR